MNIGVIFAGGVGKRMRTIEKPKQFIEINGKPIIIHTLQHFENNQQIDSIVIACIEEWIPYLVDLLKKYNIKKVKKIVPGGRTGQESIYNGLCAAKELSNCDEDIVLIHDGVRPLINQQLLNNNINDVKKYGSSVTGSLVKETIVVINEYDNSVSSIPTRANSRIAKAPQCFYLKDILYFHQKAIKENKFDFIDSCSMMKHYGFELHITDGPSENIKITTPEDFYTLRAVLQAQEDKQLFGLDSYDNEKVKILNLKLNK